MRVETIEYVDYDGVPRVEDFYFNLNEEELIDINISPVGGLEKVVERLKTEQDNGKIYHMFKEILLKSYGKKSPDGKRFIKKVNGMPINEEFEDTQAFSNLILKFFEHPDYAAKFIQDVITTNQVSDKVVPIKR